MPRTCCSERKKKRGEAASALPHSFSCDLFPSTASPCKELGSSEDCCVGSWCQATSSVMRVKHNSQVLCISVVCLFFGALHFLSRSPPLSQLTHGLVVKWRGLCNSLSTCRLNRLKHARWWQTCRSALHLPTTSPRTQLIGDDALNPSEANQKRTALYGTEIERTERLGCIDPLPWCPSFRNVFKLLFPADWIPSQMAITLAVSRRAVFKCRRNQWARCVGNKWQSPCSYSLASCGYPDK